MKICLTSWLCIHQKNIDQIDPMDPTLSESYEPVSKPTNIIFIVDFYASSKLRRLMSGRGDCPLPAERTVEIHKAGGVWGKGILPC